MCAAICDAAARQRCSSHNAPADRSVGRPTSSRAALARSGLEYVAKGGIEPPIQGFSAQREHNSQPRNQSLINACQIFSNGLGQGKTWATAYTRCTVATQSGAKDRSATRHCPAESISPMACLSDTTKSGRTTRWETCHQRAIASVWVAGRQHALGAANRARSDKPCPPPLARPHRRTHSPAR